MRKERKMTLSTDPALFQTKKTVDPLVSIGTKIPYSVIKRLEDFVLHTGRPKSAVYKDALIFYLDAWDQFQHAKIKEEIPLDFQKDGGKLGK